MIYMGSKARIAKFICPILQSTIDDNNITTYIEPFIGGGNIFDKIKCENKIGYDKSKILIALFNQGILDASIIPEEGSREWWDAAKSMYKGEVPQTLEDWQLGAISWFASYGTRGFPGGYANNTDGRDYYNERYRAFMKQLPALKEYNTSFICCDYEDIIFPETPTVVYCDPPYEGTTAYGYKFESSFNHSHYWEWVRQISKNHYVFCSEAQCPDDFEIIWSKDITRLVAAKNNYKGKEILVTYKAGLYLKGE